MYLTELIDYYEGLADEIERRNKAYEKENKALGG
ncbi:hypothetical protein J2Z76_002715 [Sedimentibacter acidaminivorans]|uniref:Uncharacterized protein n=1 Tax=Sedimentibacter acidaminivorans TaxID=913099 RepID=A0ABS4GGM7_9FIRM|nr:hypothetical protein [Sedimentibacter acidaminivorans]